MNKYIGLGIGIVLIAALAIVSQLSRQAPEQTPAPSTNVNQESAAPIVETFTAAQVATHAHAGDCYTIVDGKVYDLSAWIERHPGGPAAIESLCGRDGTADFREQHGTSGRPTTELDSFLIGILAN